MAVTEAPDHDLSAIVIGPMADKEEGPDRVPSSQHIRHISEAISICGRALSTEIEVTSAVEIKGGGVTDYVLLNFEKADFAVADISNRGANVFYELALLHSLGRPVFLLDFDDQLNDPPFFVKDERIIGVQDFLIPQLAEALVPSIADFIRTAGATARDNPVSRFYNSVPLVDASAAAGLATGYFTNFAMWMLMEGNGVMDRFNARNQSSDLFLTHLVIVKPTTIHSMVNDKKLMTELPGYHGNREYQEDARARHWKFSTAGACYLVDYPTPLLAVPNTPSYHKIAELMKRFPHHDRGEIEKMDRRLVDNYMRTIERLARHTPGVNPDRIKFMTLEELRDDLVG